MAVLAVVRVVVLRVRVIERRRDPHARPQVAMRMGFLTRGIVGSAAVAIAFVTPPFLLVTVAAVVYVENQGSTVVHALFRGVGPAIVAIVAIASVKLARTTNKRDPLLWAIAAGVLAVTVVAGAEIIWLFLAAGIFGAIFYRRGLPTRVRRSRCRPPDCPCNLEW